MTYEFVTVIKFTLTFGAFSFNCLYCLCRLFSSFCYCNSVFRTITVTFNACKLEIFDSIVHRIEIDVMNLNFEQSKLTISSNA